MNCSEARRLAVLFAGGDLSQDEAAELMAHIDYCPACAGELRNMRVALALVHDAAREDVPPPLPGDFSSGIVEAIERGRKQCEHTAAIAGKFPRWLRSAATAGAAAALVTAAVLPVREAWQEHRRSEMLREVMRGDTRKPSEIELPFRIVGDYRIEGPYRLAEWQQSSEPGIFAILHRPAPGNSPDRFVIDYLGEADRLTYRGFLWTPVIRNTLVSHIGSVDNVYIAVCRMPDSTERERRTISNVLIRKYKPYFNNGV